MSTKLKAGTATSGAVIDADTTGILELQSGSTPTTAITVDTSQNVGIGGTPVSLASTKTLTVTDATEARIQLQNTASGSTSADGVSLAINGTDFYVNNRENGNIITYVNGSERMRIDSSGNVNIGTTGINSNFRLNLTSPAGNGGIVFQPATDGSAVPVIRMLNAGLSAAVAEIGTASGTALYFNTAGSERMRIDSSGNLQGGGATVTGGSNNIWWLGTYNNLTASAANMFVASNGSFQRSTSALKYKQDIRDLESIDINKFRPVRYKSKLENDDQAKDHIGFIADEISEAGLSEIVNYGANGEVEGLQYERITAILMKAVQELNAKVDAQAAEIASLKGAK